MTKKQLVNISLIMIGGLILILTVGCGKQAKFESVYPGCSISSNMITCPDGTFYPLPADGVDGRDGINGHDGRDGVDGIAGDNGQDGSDGLDGADGQDGSDGVDGTNGLNGLITAVLDPCGDDPGHPDEVVLVLNDGRYLAWYQNLGLVILDSGVNYRTTDHQKCNFSINGGVLND